MADAEKKSEDKTTKESKTVQLQSLLKTAKGTEIDEKWVKDRSDEELAHLITTLARELESRVTKDTSKVSQDEAPTFEFEAELFEKVQDFKRVPKGASKGEGKEGKPLRLVLLSFRATHKPMGLEILDDVTIGRGLLDGTRADIDLDDYDGEELGISRRHAKISLTEAGPRLMDLGSTNGTYCNGTRLGKGMSQVIKDGDTISLGALHLKVKMVD